MFEHGLGADARKPTVVVNLALNSLPRSRLARASPTKAPGCLRLRAAVAHQRRGERATAGSDEGTLPPNASKIKKHKPTG